jgi:hypothetical protein
METLLNIAKGLGVSLEALTMQQVAFSQSHNVLNDRLNRLSEEERGQVLNIFNDILDAMDRRLRNDS